MLHKLQGKLWQEGKQMHCSIEIFVVTLNQREAEALEQEYVQIMKCGTK